MQTHFFDRRMVRPRAGYGRGSREWGTAFIAQPPSARVVSNSWAVAKKHSYGQLDQNAMSLTKAASHAWGQPLQGTAVPWIDVNGTCKACVWLWGVG